MMGHNMCNALARFVWHLRDRQRTLLCVSLGIGIGWTGWKLFGWEKEMAILFGWILGIGSYLILVGSVIFMADGPMTQSRVSGDDPNPRFLLIVVTVVALLGNAAVGVILTSVGNRPPAHARTLLALGVLSVVLSWFLLHTSFGQHYARVFFDDVEEQSPSTPGGMCRGLSFPGTEQPSYLDFLYVAFTIGLTYAVSDVTVTSDRLRRLVLIHSVISFSFNSTVLGVVLNAVVTS